MRRNFISDGPTAASALGKLWGKRRGSVRAPTRPRGMTLGFRLNLIITLLLGLILALGTTLVISNARHDVSKETQSSASLVLQLVSVAQASTGSDHSNRLWRQLVEHIKDLETTRHLDIILEDLQGNAITPVNRNTGPGVADAPAWFVHLVKPRPVEFRRDLSDVTEPAREIVIRANPAGEITEAWHDARPLLALQFLFAFLVEGLVFFTVGRAQRPLERLLTALEEVEKGCFETRLPRFKLPELGRISDKFNRMVGALEQEKNDNRRLTRLALSIQEAERRHLAQELHDELGQAISAVKALAVSIRQRAGDGASRMRENAEAVVEIADQTYVVIKTMTYRLRPVALDELGLVTALQRMVDHWNSRHAETFCSLRTESPLPDLGDDIKISVYRIVQECLTNVAKHAHASHVIVRFRAAYPKTGAGETLRLDIRDDGVGLNPAGRHEGLGLRGIRDRVAALDGEIEMSSRPQAGMAIHIALPLRALEPLR
jgi:two-component system sensor histidine kinase UhpB